MIRDTKTHARSAQAPSRARGWSEVRGHQLVLLFVAGLLLTGCADYLWDQPEVARAEQEGWREFHRHMTFDLALPWTWFNSYPYLIEFVRDDAITHRGEIALVKMYTVRRGDQGLKRTLISRIYDCQDEKYAYREIENLASGEIFSYGPDYPRQPMRDWEISAFCP